MHKTHTHKKWEALRESSDWLNFTGFPGKVCVTLFKDPPGKSSNNDKPLHGKKKDHLLK